jgi:subtilisin family serine protease
MEKSNVLKVLFIFLYLNIYSNVFSQTSKYYLVKFNNKNNSSFTINKPSDFLSERALLRRTKQNISIQNEDLPVSTFYTDSLEKLGLNVWLKSKWLNAVVIYTDEVTIKKVNSLAFVGSYDSLTRIDNQHEKYVNINSIANTESILAVNYGNSSNQTSMIGIDKMHQDGFAGQGIQIAVLDAGFKNANILSVFDSLYLNNRILGTYDFVAKENSVYEDHEHGMQVLSVLAGYSNSNLIGGAYRSSFYLFRTEDDNYESPLEEFNWAVAAEKADSLGVDIITSSLGYTDFDNRSLTHLRSDFDGKTTIAAKAAKIASRKGILVCVSAGNNGNNAWKYIGTPADTDSIIAVGAVDSQGKYASFSSIGPSADGRIKPDLSAKGSGAWIANTTGGFTSANGTSFASPILCGLAAGYWSAFPMLTKSEIINNLKISANQYLKPDNLLGYGIPNYTLAKNLVLNIGNEINNSPFIVYPNPVINNSELNIKMIDSSIVTNVLVYKTDGELMNVLMTKPINNAFSIDVSAYSKGVYLLKIITQNTNKTVQFVVL